MTQLFKRLVSHAPNPVRARVGEVAWNGGAVLCMAAAVIATIALSAQRDEHIAIYLASLAALVLGAAALVAAASRIAELYGQHARDLAAQNLLRAVLRGEPAPRFTLYLRPFAATDVFSETELVTQQVGVGARGVFFGSSERLELEAQIESALRRVGKLVALGEPLEHIGAGRIRVTDETWQKAVSALAPAAELIVLLPSSRAGTHWEIDRLLSDADLFARTVVIDPPNSHVSKEAKFDHAKEWADVQSAFATHGYALPPDDKGGSVLFYGSAREPILTGRLDVGSETDLARFFRKVIRYRRQAVRSAAGGAQ